jgi:murein DD-endopeptidase MepM/ murein hydrolase activator NlpD
LCPTRAAAAEPTIPRALVWAALAAIFGTFPVAHTRAAAQTPAAAHRQADAVDRPGTSDPVAITLEARAFRPGDALLVTIAAPPSADTVAVTAFDAEWPAYRVAPGEFRALVGIDLDTPPAEYVISAGVAFGTQTATATRHFKVSARAFRTRRLRVAPDYVNPPKPLLDRIVSEAALLRDAYLQVSPEPLWSEGMLRPVRHRANSSFGTRSVFNGEPRNPHAGTDFLSPAGTPILAPAAGRVVIARDLFFTGNTVIIDHGLGVFSMLAHMSRLDVHEGDSIARGDTVGLVGATGRVTGAHLHWALRVGAARVDPLSALAILPAGSGGAHVPTAASTGRTSADDSGARQRR